MITRLREEQSRLAGWSAYLAGLSIPVLIIAAIGHRAGLIDATPAYAIIALGFSIAALAVIAALAAFIAIWREGRKGIGRALRGFVVGLLVLVMPAFGAWKVVTDPRLTDISTDLANPPQFVGVLLDRGPGDAPIVEPGDTEAALQKDAYPDISRATIPSAPPASISKPGQSSIAAAGGFSSLANRRPRIRPATSRRSPPR